MTEHELRLLVRDAIAKQLNRPARPAEPRDMYEGVSFAQFGVSSGAEGTCIIEPSVMCNHCGYCKSYGH